MKKMILLEDVSNISIQHKQYRRDGFASHTSCSQGRRFQRVISVWLKRGKGIIIIYSPLFPHKFKRNSIKKQTQLKKDPQ